MKRFFHRHRFEITACQDWPHGMTEATLVLCRCRCGLLETEFITGHWTLSELQGKAQDELAKLEAMAK